MSREQVAAILGAVAIIGAIAVVSGGVGAAPGASNDVDHGAAKGNYTVDLPFATDHYPRDQNPGGPYNASINHLSASTPEQLEAAGGEKGVEQAEFIIISNQDIDFSQCATENTGAFGIDRDNDDSGTVTDVGLLQYRENSEFRDHSIVVNLYEGDELAGPSPSDKGGPGENPGEKGEGREDGDGNVEVYPDDEIVSHQGYKSGGGPCYGMPTEPGWYQINGFLNGTAFNGEYIELNLPSHYFYICACDSEREAYDQLGAPPGQENPYANTSGDGSSSPGATATATATATPESASEGGGSADTTATATATATPTSTATATPEPASDGGDPTATPDSSNEGASTATATPTATGGDEGDDGQAAQRTQQDGGGSQSGGQQAQQQQAAGVTTPTAGAGPGFGLVAALGGLAAAALLALRRD